VARDRQLNFRVSEDEANDVTEAAERAGLTVGEWLRVAAQVASGSQRCALCGQAKKKREA
jgi:uncharacterized protein (DUF1778 family)